MGPRRGPRASRPAGTQSQNAMPGRVYAHADPPTDLRRPGLRLVRLEFRLVLHDPDDITDVLARVRGPDAAAAILDRHPHFVPAAIGVQHVPVRASRLINFQAVDEPA